MIFINMVAIMDSNIDSNTVYHFVTVDAEQSLWEGGCNSSVANEECNHSDIETAHTENMVVRSLAMSANVASIVKDEVRHLIKVSTLDVNITPDTSIEENEESIDVQMSISKEHFIGPSISQSSCSHILPVVDGNIIFAIILSRWDDIMGPQTVHAWLQENQNPESNFIANKTEVPYLRYTSALPEMKTSGYITCIHQLPEQNMYLTKAVKYVTSHTVNYTGLASDESFSALERESNLFVVPDLGLVAQSLVFHVHSDTMVPFSLAVLVKYQHYRYFLHLRCLFHQWLRRMSCHLQEPILKCVSTGTDFGDICGTKFNNWVLELWHTVFSLGTCGLGDLVLSCGANILTHPLLERALTSHLQTFGCSVVMGSSSTDINTLISFLALFLNTDERFCSRFVLPAMKYSYHIGLFIQGLLLDEFGCRELCSIDLAATPYLVTAVDLTKGVNPSAVRQTSPQNLRKGIGDNCSFNTSSGNISKTLLHRSILYPVRESSCLVKALLKDMRHISPNFWQDLINLFVKKIDSLAYMLLNFIHHLSMECKGSADNRNLQRYLMKNMNLLEGDFLVVLAAAEKLKPGIYSHVMELDVCRR